MIDQATLDREMEEAQHTMGFAACFVFFLGIVLCLALVFVLGIAAGALAFGWV